jgi:hypothetical protein
MKRFPIGAVRIVLAAALLAALLITTYAAAGPMLASDKVPLREVAFRHEMRRLWEDHVTWTRLFIVSAVADLPDAGPPPNGCCRTRLILATRSSPTTATLRVSN